MFVIKHFTDNDLGVTRWCVCSKDHWGWYRASGWLRTELEALQSLEWWLCLDRQGESLESTVRAFLND